MCLFVRSSFIIDPYFKTKASHQRVYPNASQDNIYELCYEEEITSKHGTSQNEDLVRLDTAEHELAVLVAG